jgi:hypothetical protein
MGMSLGIEPLDAPGATGSYDSDFASKAKTVGFFWGGEAGKAGGRLARWSE